MPRLHVFKSYGKSFAQCYFRPHGGQTTSNMS